MLFLYFRNKQDLEEFVKAIIDNEDCYLEIMRDPQYKIIRSLNNRLQVMIKKIKSVNPKLYTEIELILTQDL